MKKKFLYDAMPAGFKFKKPTNLVPPEDTDLDSAFDHLLASSNRLEDEAPSKPHPFFGALSHAEWQSLALRHAELHLGFVHPAAEFT